MTHLEDRRSPWQPIELLCKKHIPYNKIQKGIIETLQHYWNESVFVLMFYYFAQETWKYLHAWFDVI